MRNLTIAFALGASLLGCSSLPITTEIKEDHFRFENFKRDIGPNLEYVHLMCFHKKPVGWAEPKQYPSGKQNLWVKARVLHEDFLNSEKEAFVNFNVDLKPEISYMLNREINENNITLWIQEVNTGVVVSDVKTETLERPLQVDESLRRRQCRTSSV